VGQIQDRCKCHRILTLPITFSGVLGANPSKLRTCACFRTCWPWRSTCLL
jgi:hypothetical protein